MDKFGATIYILVSIVTDVFLIDILQTMFFILLIMIQLLMLALFVRWNQKGKREENDTIENGAAENIDEYFRENAIIATRIVFLIINIPMMAVILSWKTTELVCGIEITVFFAIYMFEKCRKIKFLNAGCVGINVLLKGYAISGLAVMIIYITDILSGGFFGLLAFEFDLCRRLICLNISVFVAMFLLCRNEKIVKWICSNYKKDPIMLEAYERQKNNQR